MSFAQASAQTPDRQLGSHADQACDLSNPTTNETDDLIAFESNCDLTGGNPDGNREIFQVDVAGEYTQLTDTTGCANANPSSNSTGDVVAFDSDCDFEDGGLDRTPEIFIVRAGGVVEQITDHGALDRCASLAPSINAAGDLIAFDSDCDPVGSNFERNTEIFQATTGGVIRQLSDDRTLDGCGSFNAASNAAGDVVVFESDCDLTGGNEDEMSVIFRIEIDNGPAQTLTQVTFSDDDACFSALPAIDASGDTVAFESSCDFAGTNGDGGVEVFRAVAGGPISQLSDNPTADCESFDAAINGSGVRVAYVSFCDPFGGNADGGFDVFTATAVSAEQITGGTSCWYLEPTLGFGVGATTLIGNCDPASENADGSFEIFQSDQTRCGACGGPLSGRAWPSLPIASDALFVLRASIAASICPLCECDVDSSGVITATDALRVLRLALGTGVEPNCP